MPIPDYQQFMLPLLEIAGDGKEHRLLDTIEILSDRFHLTEEEKNSLLPSGTQKVIYNRVSWARTYLQKSKLLEFPRRGYFKITDRGHKILQNKPEKIDYNFLEQFSEFREFKSAKNKSNETIKEEGISEKNPEESLELAYEDLNQELAQELLETVKNSSPLFFEKLVIDLLIRMGYGGSRKDAGKAIGKSGDEGIDGTINEDRLGLDVIYVQAKRWENVVSRPEIQKFAGALQGQRAKKGIFITTSKFSTEAQDYVRNIDSKIILIDGEILTKLMIEHNVGVSTVSSYEVKKLDLDYFEQ
ncbi:MAG: restriction endonuclease [Sedimentisphaerales bacterium]|nr:restriction endonuclease [Sedimentisphaerales bacterium]